MISVNIGLVKSNLDSPCWIWQGSIDPSGYGRVANYYSKGSHERAYRLTYKSLMDCKLTKEEHLHHKCEVKSCVNPTHLELSTNAQHRIKHGNFTQEGKCKLHSLSVVKSYSCAKGGKQFHCSHCKALAAQRYRKRKEVKP